MVKLLVYYHPDSATAAEIESFVKKVAAECAASDIALMLEPLSYSLNPAEKKLAPAERRRVVVKTARRLMLPNVDLLKAEFPADATDEGSWADACGELSAACPAPWIVLSAAVDFDTYLRQVRVACEAGASGIAVGRAVWKEAVSLTGEARAHFLREVALSRLARLTSLCNALARPWTDFYEAPSVDAKWYASYP
jgi:tagatose-1,6-bisphosphate aldolase